MALRKDYDTDELSDRLRRLLADALVSESEDAVRYGQIARSFAEHKADLLILEIIRLQQEAWFD